MTRAAMLAALIVSIAMQPAAAEPFYREDLRILYAVDDDLADTASAGSR
jgi:hypothetical protein